jgi:hypothetical protein
MISSLVSKNFNEGKTAQQSYNQENSRFHDSKCSLERHPAFIKLIPWIEQWGYCQESIKAEEIDYAEHNPENN